MDVFCLVLDVFFPGALAGFWKLWHCGKLGGPQSCCPALLSSLPIKQGLTNTFFGDVLTAFIMRTKWPFPGDITLIDFTLNFSKYSYLLYNTCPKLSIYCTFIWSLNSLFLVEHNNSK